MSDYTKTTNFTTKDSLSSGDPDKLIKGSLFDTEFDNLATAVNTKYDVNDIASQAQAEALSSSSVLMSPQGVSYVLAANGGFLEDIQALSNPGVDSILGWDNSGTAAINYTLGDGIETNSTAIQLASTLGGAGLTLTSGVLAVGAGSGLTVNANDVQITNVSAGANNPVNISSGTFTFDISALGSAEGSALAATDTIVVDMGGTATKVAIQDLGMRVQLAQTTQTVAAGDMNSIMEFTGTATLTLPLNATVDLPVGVPIVLNMKHASQELTVTADTSVTLVSVFHPGGGSAASDTVSAGGTAILYKTAADVWCIAGDIST